MENINTKVEETAGHVRDYFNTLYELTEVKIIQKTANSAAWVVTGFTLLIFALLVFFIAGIGLAWWLGGLMNSMAGGFFVVAGFYGLCLLVIILFHKKIIFPVIRQMIIKKIYD